MRTSTQAAQRVVLALAAAATAVAGAALPAQASPTGAAHGDRSDAVELPPGGGHPVSAQEGAGSGDVRATAVAPAGCTPGLTRSRTLLTEGFEGPLPGTDFTEGWAHSSDGTPSGTFHTQSFSPGGQVYDEFHPLFLDDAWSVAGTRTVLSFLIRGTNAGATPPESNVAVRVNDEWWSLYDLEPDEWFRISIDVTVADTDVNDYLDVMFLHAYDPSVIDTELELDDVQLISCTPPSASGVRGDWTGEGLVDVLGVTGDGALYLYPGRGNGTVASGTQVGAGWGAMTWMGSPGDITGDRRTDLLARRSDGVLFRYDGRGAGAFGSATQVGTGWNGMTAIATGGDLNGDRVNDVLGRHADGRLFQYGITAAGRLTSAKQVGSGWNGMRDLVALGDVDGDRRADLLGVHTNGDLYLYFGAASGLRNGGKVGSGWGAMELVSSPGDLNRDGRGDVVARSASGDLWFYAGTATGVRAGVRIGTGWGAMTRLL